MRHRLQRFWYLGILFFSVACLAAPQLEATPTSATETPGDAPRYAWTDTPPAAALFTPEIPAASASPEEATPAPKETIRFAVIGDYGSGNQNAGDVANLVKGWEVDFIITTGDNNYPHGSAETVDHRVGKFYHEFIHPYHGVYGQGAEQNRFFPSLGNHDWDTAEAKPYLDYFTLPGNERYYDFVWGAAHLFALDMDWREPDGVGAGSNQASWFRERISASASPWKIVYMHHPPYSSGHHGSIDWARWLYKEWGATAVLAGHDHSYERLIIGGFPYFVNGLGGGAIYGFKEILEGSQARFNEDYGAMLVAVTDEEITFQFITRKEIVVDRYTIRLED